MVAAARLKLQTPAKKLELARYKQQLLIQAQKAREAALRDRRRQHERSVSFWNRNFSFASKAFPLDRDGEVGQRHSTL